MNRLRFGEVTVVRGVLQNPKSEDEVLLLHRHPQHTRHADRWELPGGQIYEYDEDRFASIQTAFRLKTGYEVKIINNALSHIQEYVMEDWKPPGLYIAYAGMARYVSGEFTLSDEHDDYMWADPREVLERPDLKLTRQAKEAIGLHNDFTIGFTDLWLGKTED